MIVFIKKKNTTKIVETIFRDILNSVNVKYCPPRKPLRLEENTRISVPSKIRNVWRSGTLDNSIYFISKLKKKCITHTHMNNMVVIKLITTAIKRHCSSSFKSNLIYRL